MCPSCLRALHEEFQGIEKLAKNEEFKTLMNTVKEAVAGSGFAMLIL
jgi:superoxide dismutase